MDRKSFEQLAEEKAFGDSLPSFPSAPSVLQEKNEDSPFRPADFSDAGNSQVFVQICSNELLWCDALGWLYFNGTNWERNDHKAVDLAKGMTGMMLEDAKNEYAFAEHRVADLNTDLALADDSQKAALKAALVEAKQAVKEAGTYLAHTKKSRDAGRIKGMLELSKSSLVVKVAQLDADPLLLNTPSGTVDLRTGRITPHNFDAPGLYCTHITKVSPEAAGSESDRSGEKKWREFLWTITCEDDSLAGFLQIVAGMSLLGKVYQECIIMANGCGRNGKSTFFNALAGVLGNYAGSIDPRVLTTDRQNKGAALATLRGKRLVIAAELEEHQRLSTSTLKQLASTDQIVIEEKYRQPETVTPSHTLILFTNFLPRVGSIDEGTWRRIKIVPFNAVIPESKGIQNYADVLIQEAGPAILSWAIEGAVNFIKDDYKLTEPDAVAEATEAYRERENWIENFISERCIKEPGAKVGARALYEAYSAWSKDTGEFVRRENDFKAAMEAAGYERRQPKGKFTYYGLRVDPEFEYGGSATRWGATG